MTVLKITFKTNTKQNGPLWAMQFIPHPLHTWVQFQVIEVVCQDLFVWNVCCWAWAVGMRRKAVGATLL